MYPLRPDEAVLACERVLQETKRYNLEHNILRSEVAVAERLLRRRTEMMTAYQDLYDELRNRPGALETFFGQLLTAAAFWSPDRIAQARAARDELAEVNREIAEQAASLASLIERRAELQETSGFSSETHYHVCAVIEAAAQRNPLFSGYVRDGLRALRGRFDLKYWPTLGGFVEELGRDAGAAELYATDPMTEAATAASRHSLADFFKALFAAIDDNRTSRHGRLPDGFTASDNTFATLANCALDLGPDELVDGPYVKRLRQRERAAGK